MGDSIAEYGSQKIEGYTLAILIIISVIAGPFLIFGMFEIAIPEILPLLFVVCLIPIILMFVGVAIGRRTKLKINYNPPNWEFTPQQFEIEKARSLIKSYRKKYDRLVSYGPMWLFYAPIFIIISNVWFSLYIYLNVTTEWSVIALAQAIVYPLILSVSAVLGDSASSNDASEDFTLPLIREAVHVAKIQSKITGVSYTRVILDEAQAGDFKIYRKPRVLIRLEGIEEDAYIESWSDELDAVERVMCRLYHSDKEKSTFWWWFARDRFFRKYEPGDEEGYYVKNPVPSLVKELGVKDIDLISRNAVAIVLQEWLRLRGPNDTILKNLKAVDVLVE